MQFNNELVIQLAWPAVVLVAMLILGPGGALARVFREIAQSFGRFSEGYSDLKEIIGKTHDLTAELESSLSKLRTQSSQMEYLKGEVHEFKDSIDRLRLLMDQTNSDVDRIASRTEPSESKPSEFEGETPELSPEEAERLYSEVVSEWETFDRVFRSYVESLGEAYDGRAVGSIALSLADGRRRFPLDRATAELIDNNFFEIKSMRRTKEDMQNWGSEYFSVMKRDINRTTRTIEQLASNHRTNQG